MAEPTRPTTATTSRTEPRSRRSRPLVAATLAIAAAAALALSACSSAAVPSDPKLAQGQEVYNTNCVACHGSGGGGGTGPRLIGIGDRMTEEQEIATITDGVAGTAMPAWGGRLSPEEIEAVAAYTRSLKPAG